MVKVEGILIVGSIISRVIPKNGDGNLSRKQTLPYERQVALRHGDIFDVDGLDIKGTWSSLPVPVPWREIRSRLG